MNKAITAVKDGYLKAVNWIAINPQKTFWAGSAVAVMAVVAAIF